MFKDELGEKIMKEFCALRPRTYSYVIDSYDDDYDKNKIINKKAKGTKKCVIKRRLMIKNYKDPLFNDKIILKSQQRFKSDYHKAYTEEVNKIVLSSDDDERLLQTFDKTTTYPHRTNIFKVCESDMLKACEAKAKLKMLSKESESEMYVKEEKKGKCF